jgi:hypothetical protein
MDQRRLKRKYQAGTPIYVLLLFLVLITSCNGQYKTNVPPNISESHKKKSKTIPNNTSVSEYQLATQKYGMPLLTPPRISDFVRRIFQDNSGNLWFGTNGDGVIRYNGDSLQYFSIDEGFGGVAVRGIIEDKKGNVWFGTERGITKYD